MARTRVRWDRVAVVGAALAASLWVAGQAVGGSEPVPAGSLYRVRAGDTLWDIARRRVGPEGDPRPLVADIREANALGTAALEPGQALVLPSS